MPSKYARRRADRARKRLLVAGVIIAVLIVAAGIAEGGRGEARTGQGAANCGVLGSSQHIGRGNTAEARP